MSAYEIYRNYTNRYCEFALDNESDLCLLPTDKKSGSGILKLSTPCRQGSIAMTTDGKRYVLGGNSEWSASSSLGGITEDQITEMITEATKQKKYETMEDAVEALNSGQIGDVYLGKTVLINRNGKYLLYSIQQGEDGYTLDPVDTYGETSTWDEDED